MIQGDFLEKFAGTVIFFTFSPYITHDFVKKTGIINFDFFNNCGERFFRRQNPSVRPSEVRIQRHNSLTATSRPTFSHSGFIRGFFAISGFSEFGLCRHCPSCVLWRNCSGRPFLFRFYFSIQKSRSFHTKAPAKYRCDLMRI